MYPADASIYTDFQGVARLKAAAQADSAGALDEVAQQFEALFMQMMLKSMRDANLSEGLLDNDQSRFYRDMYDQQLAIHVTRNGGLGLADVLKRQLGGDGGGAGAVSGMTLNDYRRQPVAGAPVPTRAAASTPTAAPSPRDVSPEPEELGSPGEFLRRLWPLAREAAAKLGQEPDVLLAQAALETGWGRNMIRTPDGASSFNLFGIKADSRWPGERVTVPTLEFEQGVAVRRKATFRAYGSFAESFRDYADFVLTNSRYRPALEAGDGRIYLASLQESGYATDPRYAEKILAILERPETKQVIEYLKSAGHRP